MAPPPAATTGSHQNHRPVWLSQKASNMAASLPASNKEEEKEGEESMSEEGGGEGDTKFSPEEGPSFTLNFSCTTSSSGRSLEFLVQLQVQVLV